MYTGGAGGYTFYVRDGEQVVRQRRNNSNYGESASRSESQQLRRVKWGNLVNFYKIMKSWQPKAYESKSKGQTDYNIFMSLNINNAPVSLTKQMVLQGCAVVYAYNVSRGSLPKIERALLDPAEGKVMAIKLTQAISSSTSVGQFATDVIANNPEFQANDNLAFIIFNNTQDSENFPYATSVYKEVTLDPTSTALLSSVIGSGRFEKTTAGNLLVNVGAADSHEAGFVLIHTRKVSGSLQVSTQYIITTGEEFHQEYSSPQWEQTCIDSYGVDVDVPLDPSFRPGTISSVTANSVEVSQGDILSGQQTLRVYGTNLYGSNFKLIANNVVYTPLEVHDGYLQYSITENAEIVLQLNGRQYLSFRVDGVVIPTELSGFVRGQQAPDTSGQGLINTTEISTGCLMYPHEVSEGYPLLRVLVGVADGSTVEEQEITGVNCTLSTFNWNEQTKRWSFYVTPVDTEAPVYVIYDGFIFFVGNYS